MSLQRRQSHGHVSQARSAGLERPRTRGGTSTPYTSSGRPVKVDDGRRVVVAGYVGPDRVFRKKVAENQVLRKPEGIAVQTRVLEHLRLTDCAEVEVHLYDGRRLFAPVERFFTRGLEFDRGYGKQRVLGLSHWEDRNSPQLSLGGLL